MKILVIMDLVPGTTFEQIAPYYKEEAARAWELYKEGIFRDMNFRLDKPSVVNIMECDSVEQAREFVETLPLAKAGFLTFEFMPLGYASWFEHLWK